MKIDKKFVLREIAGEYIIIPTGKTALDFKGLITVNEVGVSIWKMLQNDVTLEELVQGILNEYEVEEEVARDCLLYTSGRRFARDNTDFATRAIHKRCDNMLCSRANHLR